MVEKYNWDLTDIFKSNVEYNNTKNELNKVLEEIAKYQGKLCDTSEALYDCYNLYEHALELYEKIYAYGMFKYHLDMSNQEAIKLFKEVENIGTNFSTVTSFMVPEITNQPEDKIITYLNENIKLKKYERVLKEILEDKKHILSAVEENLLANYSEIFSNSENTYDIFTNAELKYGDIIDSDGSKVQLTDANYTNYLRSKDEEVRKQAFNLMYDKYSEFTNTITELYISRVKEDTITSKIRKYKSSLERAVKNDDSSIKVYESLISTLEEKMNINHEFMKLKKEMLKLPEMHMYDIYLNPIEISDDKITYEYAQNEILAALAVLGEEYTNKLKEAFENRWIDVYEKENKRSGAYSMGVYGLHPFILANFIGSKRDISTIAHELGHSMHSYYSNKNQNILDSNYTIMVAEVASTVNELLLSNYQIKKETSKTKKAELIYEMLEMIRATLFRQAMFAEFEKIVHEKIEKNEMLSSENLCNIYYDLNKKYFGEEVIVDEKIRYEWSRIPHFYTPFYVYKYATGISAAIAITSKILNNEPGYVEKYKEMLKQGCSKKSIELLKMVDVDLESKKPYEEAIEFYNKNIKELQKLI